MKIKMTQFPGGFHLKAFTYYLLVKTKSVFPYMYAAHVYIVPVEIILCLKFPFGRPHG